MIRISEYELENGASQRLDVYLISRKDDDYWKAAVLNVLPLVVSMMLKCLHQCQSAVTSTGGILKSRDKPRSAKTFEDTVSYEALQLASS